MQREAKVTADGRVTIPAEIRDALSIQEGDTIIFESDERGIHLRPGKPRSVFAEQAGILREGDGLSLEEILARQHEMRGLDEHDRA